MPRPKKERGEKPQWRQKAGVWILSRVAERDGELETVEPLIAISRELIAYGFISEQEAARQALASLREGGSLYERVMAEAKGAVN